MPQNSKKPRNTDVFEKVKGPRTFVLGPLVETEGFEIFYIVYIPLFNGKMSEIVSEFFENI